MHALSLAQTPLGTRASGLLPKMVSEQILFPAAYALTKLAAQLCFRPAKGSAASTTGAPRLLLSPPLPLPCSTLVVTRSSFVAPSWLSFDSLVEIRVVHFINDAVNRHLTVRQRQFSTVIYVAISD